MKKNKNKGYYEKSLDINGEKYFVTVNCRDGDFVTVRFYIHPYNWFPWYIREVYYDCDYLIRADGSKATLKDVVIRMASEFINDIDDVEENEDEDEDFKNWNGIIKTSEVNNSENTDDDNDGG